MGPSGTLCGTHGDLLGPPGPPPRHPSPPPQEPDLKFTPRHRFATFALRLGPFGSVFRDGAPVCSENGAFRPRAWDLNFPDGAPVCGENAASFHRVSDPNGNHRFAAERMGWYYFRREVSQLIRPLAGSGSGARGGLFLTSTRTLKRYPLLGKYVL